jgi:hypothetical protein
MFETADRLMPDIMDQLKDWTAPDRREKLDCSFAARMYTFDVCRSWSKAKAKSSVWKLPWKSTALSAFGLTVSLSSIVSSVLRTPLPMNECEPLVGISRAFSRLEMSSLLSSTRWTMLCNS